MIDHVVAHDPAAEAAAVVGDGYDVRVLEPSPPAVADPPFWADDPAHPGGRGAGPVVAPHTGADLTWDDLTAARPGLSGFAADRWLGARRRLPALPPDYPSALFDFHRLAYSVVAEARYQCNGKFGLRYVRGGFGTPFFGDDVQVRVAGDRLVVQEAGQARAAPITTLREAGEFVGVDPGTTAREHDSPDLGDIDRPLDTRAEVGEFLGAWFGLATAALEELRFSPGVTDPERVQLWPGHFDPAIAAGEAESGRRATFGFSPGDHSHDEPYIYVAAWGDVDRSDPFGNEEDFNGASLRYSELCAAEDHYGAAVDFLRGRAD
ncbi:MAG: hypothetical protein F4110_08410 [Acidimicrobiaceae bacterium]|nr:hypothetical protein [Acidimicrobiaceae bacterium]MXZ97481.1 hypothetical protein [Acidimicrobiaceae bacterium]MYE76748.1 hypothetical protein [Acidimicrobiaceae bacterium]MYE96894.1 hypothetical protein [Acidimicrobiaceae bacterium]MYI53985.1 hypothetical protein [Acidimicrobiaceae bacterium]